MNAASARTGAIANVALLVASLGGALVLHYPGQVTFDGITIWFESRQAALFSQHPPALALLWHVLEWILPGPGLFCVVQVGALWLAAWLLVARLRPPLFWAMAFYAGLFLCPSVFALSAQLGKDELGAHLSVLAAVAILLRPGRRVAPGFVASAFAALVRYQFAIVTLCLLAAVARDRRAALAGVASVLATAVLVNAAISATFARPDSGDVAKSVRKILIYDIAGGLALSQPTDAPILSAQGVDAALVQQRAKQFYTPDRVDTLWQPDSVFPLLDAVPDAAIWRQWADTAERSPWALLHHRILAFARVIGIGDVYACWPVAAGISTIPPDRAEAVRADTYAPALSADLLTARWFPAGTFLFRGWVYGVVSLLLLAGAAARRVPPAAAMLAGSGLLYELSFAALPQACDVRYSYFLMLSAIFAAAIALFHAVSARHL